MRPFLAFLQITAGCYGIVINLVAFRGLNHCTQLNHFVMKLMKSVCVANLFGLVPILFYSPWAFAFATNILNPGSFPMNVLAGMLVFSIYSQFALQALIAVNRMFAFRYPSATFWFTPNRVNGLIGICLLYGCFNGLLCLFPCCIVVYLGPQGRWITNGTHHYILQKLQFSVDLITFPTMIICQSVALFSLDRLRKQVSDKKISDEKCKTEIRVMIQFCLVAFMWLVYCGFFRLMQFVPSARGPTAVLISETFRYFFLTIDPTLNLVFLKQLRQYVRNIFVHQPEMQVIFIQPQNA